MNTIDLIFQKDSQIPTDRNGRTNTLGNVNSFNIFNIIKKATQSECLDFTLL